jgi:hypothetical protein
VHLGPEEEVPGAGAEADEVERAPFHRASYLLDVEQARGRRGEAAEVGLEEGVADESGRREALETDLGPEVEELAG